MGDNGKNKTHMEYLTGARIQRNTHTQRTMIGKHAHTHKTDLSDINKIKLKHTMKYNYIQQHKNKQPQRWLQTHIILKQERHRKHVQHITTSNRKQRTHRYMNHHNTNRHTPPPTPKKNGNTQNINNLFSPRRHCLRPCFRPHPQSPDWCMSICTPLTRFVQVLFLFARTRTRYKI